MPKTFLLSLCKNISTYSESLTSAVSQFFSFVSGSLSPFKKQKQTLLRKYEKKNLLFPNTFLMQTWHKLRLVRPSGLPGRWSGDEDGWTLYQVAKQVWSTCLKLLCIVSNHGNIFYLSATVFPLIIQQTVNIQQPSRLRVNSLKTGSTLVSHRRRSILAERERQKERGLINPKEPGAQAGSKKL